MLAAAVELLTGRYGASEYNDRSRAEWPPHPARLFSAVVAVWADADQPDPNERALLSWLETQAPPQLVCSPEDDVTRRNVVTVYVPVNDATALASGPGEKRAAARAAARVTSGETQSGSEARALIRAEKALRKAEDAYRDTVNRATAATGRESASMVTTALQVLPDNRVRQPRTFPSVTPAETTVWFVWPGAEPTLAQRETLDRLLARVSRLGHCATLVSARVDNPPLSPPTLVPRMDGTTVLRVPRIGLLDRLEREFARHLGTEPRVLPNAMAAYGPPGRPPPTRPTSLLSGDWFLLELTTSNGTAPTLGITCSLELARAVREALAARAAASAEGVLTGRWADGGHRPHLAVVPMPDVGHRWATGRVRGVALVLPATLAAPDRRAVREAVERWAAEGLSLELAGRRGPLSVPFAQARAVPATEHEPSWAATAYALRRWTWCRPSRRWVSATPVVLDRFVRRLNDPVAGSTAESAVVDVIARSCLNVGLPRPEQVVPQSAGMLHAVPPATARRGAFPRFVATGSGQTRQSVHAAVSFDQPVQGPLLIGAGRYLGYGLLLPVDDPRESAS